MSFRHNHNTKSRGQNQLQIKRANTIISNKHDINRYQSCFDGNVLIKGKIKGIPRWLRTRKPTQARYMALKFVIKVFTWADWSTQSFPSNEFPFDAWIFEKACTVTGRLQAKNRKLVRSCLKGFTGAWVQRCGAVRVQINLRETTRKPAREAV